MAQGKTKGLQKKQESSRHAAKAAANPKKGKRVVAPKKAAAVKTASLHKAWLVSCTPPDNVVERHPFADVFLIFIYSNG